MSVPIGTNIGRSGSSCSASPLDENAFYGFLSPKFKLKTNLSAAEVREFHCRHRTRPRMWCSSVPASTTAPFILMYSNMAMRSTRDCMQRRQGLFRADRSAAAARESGFRLQKHRAFQLLHRQAQILAGVAEDYRAAVRDRGNARRIPWGSRLRTADAVPGPARCADEDISDGTRGHLDSDHVTKFHGAGARPVCCAIPNLQIAGRHHLRRLENRLCDPRPPPIPGRLFDVAPVCEILDLSSSHQRCLGCRRRAALFANVKILLG